MIIIVTITVFDRAFAKPLSYYILSFVCLCFVETLAVHIILSNHFVLFTYLSFCLSISSVTPHLLGLVLQYVYGIIETAGKVQPAVTRHHICHCLTPQVYFNSRCRYAPSHNIQKYVDSMKYVWIICSNLQTNWKVAPERVNKIYSHYSLSSYA